MAVLTDIHVYITKAAAGTADAWEAPRATFEAVPPRQAPRARTPAPPLTVAVTSHISYTLSHSFIIRAREI